MTCMYTTLSHIRESVDMQKNICDSPPYISSFTGLWMLWLLYAIISQGCCLVSILSIPTSFNTCISCIATALRVIFPRLRLHIQSGFITGYFQCGKVIKWAHHNHKEVENPCPAVSLLLYHSNKYLEIYSLRWGILKAQQHMYQQRQYLAGFF